MNTRVALSDGRRGLRISRKCRASYKTPAAMAYLAGLGDIAELGAVQWDADRPFLCEVWLKLAKTQLQLRPMPQLQLQLSLAFDGRRIFPPHFPRS